MLKLWYRRLGQLNVKSVHTLLNMLSGMNLGKFSCPISSLFCKTCIKDKQHVAIFPNESEKRETKPLKSVHSDICNSMQTRPMGGTRYFITFIDDFQET